MPQGFLINTLDNQPSFLAFCSQNTQVERYVSPKYPQLTLTMIQNVYTLLINVTETVFSSQIKQKTPSNCDLVGRFTLN